MDNLSNRGLLGSQKSPSSEPLLPCNTSSIPLLSLFSENRPEISRESLENTLYPKKKKDPLEIPYHQKVAFAMTLLSLASSCLGEKNASLIGSVGTAVQIGLSLVHFTQNPSIASGTSIAMMGLQLAISSTPYKPVLPYINFLLQSRSSFVMGWDLWNQMGISLQHLTRENYLKVGRNLLVYGVNAMSSGYHLYRGYQKIHLSEDSALGPSQDEIEEAKKILCKGQDECPTEWTPKEIKRLFRKQSLSAHPDKNTGTDQSFHLLSKARDLLLSVFKVSSEEMGTSAQQTPTEPMSEKAPYFGVQEVSQTSSTWSAIWRFLAAFDKCLSFSVAAAEETQSRVSKGPVLDNKALAHVLADPYIQETRLEGWNFQSSVQTLIGLSDVLSDNLRDQIQGLAKKIQYIRGSHLQLEEVKHMAQQVAQKVMNLSSGEEFWLEGGFSVETSSGFRGHAMLYQWVKRVDGDYDIYIYNTGNGLEYHNQKSTLESLTPSQKLDPSAVEATSLKRRVSPVVKFKGVPARAIGLGDKTHVDPTLFEKLIALQQGNKNDDPAREIYIGVFGSLNPYRVVGLQQYDLLIYPQMSGTCSWYILIYAVLTKYLQREDILEKIAFQIEKKAFDASCDLNSSISQDLERREICIRGGHKLLVDLAGLYENGISHEDVETYRVDIEDSLNKLEVEEKSLSVNEQQALSYQGVDQSYPSTEMESIVFNEPRIERKAQTIPFPSSFLDVQTNIDHLITEATSIVEFSEVVPLDVIMRIEGLVKRLPTPLLLDTIWKEASEEQIRKSIEILSLVLSKYAEQILLERSRFLTEQITAWALYATIHHLSARLNTDLKTKYGVFHHRFKQLIHGWSFTNFRREDLQLYQDVVAYFEKLPKESDLFNIDEALKPISQDHKDEKSDEEKLFDTLLDKHETVRSDFYTLIDTEHSGYIPRWMIKRKVLRENEEIFKKHQKTAYIASLKRSAYLAHLFTITSLSMSRDRLKNSAIQGKIDSPKKVIEFESPWIANSFDSSTFYMPNYEDFFSLYLNGACLLRDHNEKRSYLESYALIKDHQEGSLDRNLDVAACSYSLQNQLTVHHFYNNIDLLSDVYMQNIFLLKLFKSYPHPDKTPIYDDLKDRYFVESVSDLIEKGLSKFFYNRERPDIKTTLFFLQLVRRLKELDPKIKLEDFSSLIDQMLNRPDLTEEEKKLLHLHRIMQYTNQKDRLLKLQKEEIATDQALKEILVSWMYVSSHKFTDWHLLHSRSEMLHFIYELSPVLDRLSPEFLHAAISDLFQESLQTFTQVSQNDPNVAIYDAQDANGQSWLINPIHGKIIRGGEEVAFGLQKDFSQFVNYKRLFGDQKFHFTRQGQVFIFQDSYKNTFRVFEKNQKLVIQLQYRGSWYELVTNLPNSGREAIPKPLVADHFIFHSKKGTLFVRKESFAVDFVDFRGISEDQENFLQKSNDWDRLLGQFEDTSWVLGRRYSAGSSRLDIPRFVSLTGNSLGFSLKEGKLSWDENPRYILKEAPEGLLGLCQNYLFVQDGEKSKILVPVKPVAPSHQFAPHCALDIQDKKRGKEYETNAGSGFYTGELNSPQEKHFLFVEYDIDNGLAKPLNSEGALFLVYLLLSQKSYTKALKILQEDLNLKKHSKLSDRSKEILTWIINHPTSSYDRSATAAALALKASLLFPKEKCSSFDDLWATYEQGLDRVEANLRLSQRECQELLQNNAQNPTSRMNNNGPWYWAISSDANYNPTDPNSQYSLMVKKLVEGRDAKLQRNSDIYNEFRKAKTPEEKIFLQMKYGDFFKKDCMYLPAFKAVMEGDGSRYSECPYSEKGISLEEARAWMSQFLDHGDLVLVSYRGPEMGFEGRTRPLAESLYKTRSKIVVPSFQLESIAIEQDLRISNILEDSFQREAVSTRQSFLEEKTVLAQPIPQNYEAAVRQERDNFIQEYRKGLDKNRNEIRFSLREGKSVEEIHQELSSYHANLDHACGEMEHLILEKVNRLPEGIKQKTLTLVLQGGQAKSKIELYEVINSFLEGKSEGYVRLNSHLTREQIQELDALVKEFLIKSLQRAHVEKALTIKDPQELGAFLSSQIAYTSSEYDSFKRQFLVYEYRAGLRMRKEQVSLILKMAKEKSCVTQLMMGGGKTSVLASNLLYFAAKPGRIAFFIPPASQFSTLKENLGNMQKKHFYQEVVPIRMQRTQLTVENLQWILKQFIQAKNFRNVILTTRETVEAIVLEYLDCLEKGDASDAKLQLLSYLVKDMKEAGDVLVDEVDLILNPMQETNFPFGSKISIDFPLIDMTRQLFEVLSSSQFDKQIRLSSNKQAQFGEKAHRAILTEVMQEFFDRYPGLNLDPTEKLAFLEFISGKNTERSFRQLLELKSKREKLQPSVEQISLVKHLFRDILPLTLSKSTGENYGRVLENVAIGPYHGVNSPSFTEFGSQWEAMSYHFQTALTSGVTLKQVEDLHASFFRSAGLTSEVQGVSLEKTWEAETFKELTGCSFSEYSYRKQEIVDAINKNPKLQLLIEANTIAQLVGYYTKYFRSSSQNFAASFSGFDSFSGTPWNPESFPRELEDHFFPDVGTEGKIIDVFLERAQKLSLKVYATTSDKPQDTLTQVLSAMQAERAKRVQGFIDSGGLFKESTGLSVAQDVLRYYAKEDRIQAVLFFDRPEPSSPMVLMALKKGIKDPIIVGGTQPKEIAKHGLTPESTFVYYDQTHCEATDILQKDDAINLISSNHRMIRRTLTQGILRLRSYFKGQDVEVVIPQEEMTQFTSSGNSPTHQDILLKVVDNQAIRKAEQTFRSYRQKMDHVLRELVMEKLRKGKSLEEEITIFRKYQDVLITKKDHNLYAQFGSAEIVVDSLDSLHEYADQKKTIFRHLVGESDRETYYDAEFLLDGIIEKAKTSVYRPSEVQKVSRDDVGTEMEVELAQETQVDVETDHSVSLELDQELQQEIEFYQVKGENFQFYERVWEDSQVDKGFRPHIYRNIKTDESIRLFTLQNVLSDKTDVVYKTDFSPLFSENFLISSNFLKVYQDRGSYIFDKKSKPARQIAEFNFLTHQLVF